MTQWLYISGGGFCCSYKYLFPSPFVLWFNWHAPEDLLRIHSTTVFSRYPKASCLSKKGFHHRCLYSKAYKLNFNGISKIPWTNQDSFSVAQKTFTYIPSYNLTPPFSRVLICQNFIFCSLTAPAGCKSLRKCTPVKCQKWQEDGFPNVT